MNERDRIIEAILETELTMFLTVNPQQTSGCQECPESFKMHRSAQLVPWSTKTLASHFNDLQAAQAACQNLMRVKYARMQGLVANEEDPLIDQILRLKISWQKEMFRKYPGIMGGTRPLTGGGEGSGLTSFEAYGRGELGTYSPRTLRLLHSDMISEWAGRHPRSVGTDARQNSSVDVLGRRVNHIVGVVGAHLPCAK